MGRKWLARAVVCGHVRGVWRPGPCVAGQGRVLLVACMARQAIAWLVGAVGLTRSLYGWPGHCGVRSSP